VILQERAGDLLLIAQGDHAALSGRVMTAWQADGFPDRPTRPAVLDATSLHDIGWEEEDTAPLWNPQTGQPYDFVSAPVAVRQRIWPRAVQCLASRDPYVAALVAQHALTIFRRFAGDAEWRDFFAALEGLRDDQFAAAVAAAASPAVRDDENSSRSATSPERPRDLSSFLQDYAIVAIGDLLSLVFCNGWRDPQPMEGYHAILHGDLLSVTPDPFGGARVPLQVRARRLPRRRYESEDDLREAWAQAPVVTLTGTAIGTSSGPSA
jgi:Protein of unknown function (DUF3891)